MVPNPSMNVDFPTPGTPEMPMRVAFPAYGASCTSTSWASSRWSARLDSTRVMARARSAREPSRTRSTQRATSARGGAGSAMVGRGQPQAGRQRAEQLGRRLGDDRPGRVDRVGPGRAQLLEVLGGDDPAHHDHHVRPPEGVELAAQGRDEREVPGGRGVDPDDVGIRLDRLPGDLLGRLEEGAHVDVEAEVGERRRDDLLAPVVAVLAHLRDEDARTPALEAFELL